MHRQGKTLLIGIVFILLSGFCLPPCLQAAEAEDNPKAAIPERKLPDLSAEEITLMAKQYSEIPVTQWVDFNGLKPTSFDEWNRRMGTPLPFSARQASISEINRDAGKICVIMNEGIYGDILASLNQYTTDLTAEGFVVEIITSSGGTPSDLRAFLQGKYSEGMNGCLLIGDLPIAWFEAECWDPVTHEEFPIDLYYMDLNGSFNDNDFDGKYDEHTGDLYPEIWVGRLTASLLTIGGASEVGLLNNYFSKNHQYRTGNLPVQGRGLTYVDDDWVPWADWWNDNHGLTYETRTLVSDGAATIDTDYEGKLPDGFRSILLCSHSGSASHHFKIGEEWTGGVTSNIEIKYIDPQAIFYNLFACSNSRYVDYDYMGGWYIFCQDYGLASIGSTKTGAMLSFEYFYNPFGACATIGEAFRDWFSVISDGGFTVDESCWHYGMTLCGDPTLRFETRQPLEITSSALMPGRISEPYSASLASSGGLAPVTWEIVSSNLPDGLGMDLSTGIISGIPGEFGTFNLTIGASDDCAYPNSRFSDEMSLNLEIYTQCGDLNWDNIVNILDIVVLINFEYKDGSDPNPMANAYINDDGVINILDIIYLINKVYKEGPDPICP